MAKATNTKAAKANGPAKPAKAPKPEAAPEKAAKPAKPAKQEIALLTVSSKALALDVGPAVIKLTAQSNSDEREAQIWNAKVNYARGEAVGRLTLGVFHAAKADPKNFNLADVFSADSKKKEALINRLQIALGVKEQDEDGKLSFTEAVAEYFPAKGSTKASRETPEYMAKDQFAKNWVTSVKKAAEAALGIATSGATPSFNAEARALEIKNPPKLLAGPGVKSLVLSGGKTKTGQQASVKAFNTIAAKAHKAVSATEKKGKKGEATNRAQAALQSEDAFGELCNAVITAINGLEGTLSGAQRKHLEALEASVTTALDWPVTVHEAQQEEAHA